MDLQPFLVPDPEFGPGLASEALIGGVTPTEPMTEVDSAIAALSAIAREVDIILDRFDATLEPPTAAA